MIEKAFKKALDFALFMQKPEGYWDGPISPTLFQSGLVAYAFKHSKEKEWYNRLYNYVENYPVFKKIKNKYAERYLLHYEWIFHEGVRALVIEDEIKARKIAKLIKTILGKEGKEKIARKFLILAVLFVQEGYLSWSDFPDAFLEKIKFFSKSDVFKEMPWRYVTYAAIAARYFYDKEEYDETIKLVKKIIKYKSDNGSWNEYPFITAFIAAVLNKMGVVVPEVEDYFIDRQFVSGGFSPISAKIWDTVYAINVLKGIRGFRAQLNKSYNFLLRNRLPGGLWGWDVGGNMDFDTTSMAIHVLPYASVKKQRNFLVLNQKEDGSWGTWTKNDDSSIDVTAHCLIALGKSFPENKLKAIEFLLNSNERGAWFPFWYTNVYYGISQVIEALQVNGFNSFEDSISFIEKNQNKDGGWGELPGFESSAVATSHAVFSLIKMNELDKAKEGIDWLLRNQNNLGTWNESKFAVGPYPLMHSDFNIMHFSSLLCFHHFLFRE